MRAGDGSGCTVGSKPRRTDDNSGGVSVFSGRDGVELYTILGTASEDGFGYSIDGVGDVNGDGFDDFVAGSLSVEDVSTPGYARLVSGLDGSELFTWPADPHGASRMVMVSGAGDVDGDRIADFLIGVGVPAFGAGYFSLFVSGG